MKLKLLASFVLILNLSNNLMYSQSTSTGVPAFFNVPSGTGDFLGWSFGTFRPLEIRNDNTGSPFPINWYTQSIARMQIYEDVYGNNPQYNGFVGIGDFGFTIGAVTQSDMPKQLLHIHDNTHTVSYTQWTNQITSSLANHGLLVGNNGTEAQIIQQDEDATAFYNYFSPTTLNTERMRIFQGPTSYFPASAPSFLTNKVSISRSRQGNALHNMISLLNLGTDVPIYSSPDDYAGWRYWMDVGTYMNFQSDNMYVGLKQEGQTDRLDAVINWGDNITQSQESNVQNLRFIFTSIGKLANSYSDSPSATWHGLETARITSKGNMGIGDFYNNNVPIADPICRLEILDAKDFFDGNYPNTSLDQPQLRLTYTQTGGLQPGIFTDFQTTSIGDLYIHPYGLTESSPSNRYVGINVSTPGNTLEINSNNTYSTSTIGYSGLRFTDMQSGSLVSPFNGKVLSVDGNGDVILVNDQGGSNSVTPCTTVVAGDINYITKWTATGNQICRTSGIYESSIGSNNVGIGVGTSPNNKLHVGGDINVNSSADVYKIGNQTVLRIGNLSTFVGVDAGGTTGGDRSTFVGYHAGYNSGTSSTDNTFMGDRAGLNNTTGSLNTFIGQSAGKGNIAGITGTSNICLGNLTGISLQSASNNLIAGVYSGYYNATGNDNVLLGSFAGYPTVSADNTFVGSSAGSAHTTGNGNTFIGKSTNDVAYSPGSSEYSTLLGYNASAQSGTSSGLSNATALGANCKVECDNCLVLGSSGGSTQVKVGIGYTNPTTATGTPGSEQFLLYVKDIPSSTTPPCTTGCVSTNSAFFKGNIYAANTWYPSDSTLKLNVQTVPATSSISLLSSLTPKTYTFDQARNPQLALPAGLQYGLIAEEVERVLPNLVKTITAPAILDTAGNVVNPDLTFKALNYTGLIPLLLAATKEQQASIDSLKDELKDIKKQIEDCCTKTSAGGTGSARLSVTLENSSAIILDQNTPNPFAEQTTITFTIPDEIQKAQIMFYEKSGRVMKVVEVQERGKGSLTVYAENLSSGIYSYSLIADGKLIDTKKMVCSK